MSVSGIILVLPNKLKIISKQNNEGKKIHVCCCILNLYYFITKAPMYFGYFPADDHLGFYQSFYFILFISFLCVFSGIWKFLLGIIQENCWIRR